MGEKRLRIYLYMSKYSDNSEIVPDALLPVLSDPVAVQVAEFFGAFSDASRVKLVSVLTHGELNVGAIAEFVGISESAVSHHLRSLRHLRLVRARKEGRQVFYSLDDEHIAEIFRAGVQHVAHG
jgi:ArsR family transcriptional regulator, lead/cadmium/zinc/bismuth-responsive transcriptional repressor